MSEGNLSDFLRKHGSDLAARIESSARPLFRPGRDARDPRLDMLERRLLPAQGDAAMGLHLLLRRRRAVNLVAEMGVGKTIISLAVTWLQPGPVRTLVMCPSHLVEKWVREILETIPEAKARIVRNLADLTDPALRRAPEGREFLVLSKEKAKLGYAWRPAVARDRAGWFRCLDCNEVVTDHNDDPATLAWLKRSRRKCPECGAPLWTADNTRFRRYPLARYILRKIKGRFDFLIADEVHQYKSDSAQGTAFGLLVRACKRTVTLTGTLNGGYADDLFLLLARTDLPALRRRGLGFGDGKDFARIYGVVERIAREDDPLANTRSLGNKSRVRVRRRPGVSPLVFAHFLAGSSAFLRLADVADDLPPFEEFVHGTDMTGEQARFHQHIERNLTDAMRRTRGRLLGSFMNTLLAWPDKPHGFPPVHVPDEDILVTIPDLPGAADDDAPPLPKEKMLVELVGREADEGRRVFVFCAYTGRHDVSRRIADLLGRRGIRATVLPASVRPDKREQWLVKKAREGFKAVVGNPRLVETGLDLYDFPTLVFVQTGLSIHTLRQASRRSWRIGQKYPVRVHYLYYRGTLQEKVLALMGAKLEASLALEGEFSEDGLAALTSGGGDTAVMLARALAGKIEVPSVEEVWRRQGMPWTARPREARKIRVEPTSAAVAIPGDRQMSLPFAA